MDARTYLDTHGDAGVGQLIEALKAMGNEPDRPRPAKRCTVGYFKQIAYGYRRPSLELAEDLAEASRVVAKEMGRGDELDVMALLKAREIHAAKAAGEGGHASRA